MEPLNYFLEIMYRFQDEYDVDLRIDYVSYELLSTIFPRASYIKSFKYRMIKVPKLNCKETFKEYAYHEIAHAYLDSCHVKRKYTKYFGKFEDQSLYEYYYRTLTASSDNRPYGFITNYASVNSEEDFAETFSAYLCNRNKYLIHYNGSSIDIRKEAELLKKFKAIHELLHN